MLTYDGGKLRNNENKDKAEGMDQVAMELKMTFSLVSGNHSRPSALRWLDRNPQPRATQARRRRRQAGRAKPNARSLARASPQIWKLQMKTSKHAWNFYVQHSNQTLNQTPACNRLWNNGCTHPVFGFPNNLLCCVTTVSLRFVFASTGHTSSSLSSSSSWCHVNGESQRRSQNRIEDLT